MINSRLKTILRELMSVKTPLTGAYLANLNKVTPRTTREDIKMLDDLLRMHGARISSLMGRGYQLEVLDDQKFRSFLRNLSAAEQDSAPMPPKTPEERIKYIIRRLLLCDDYLKLDDLAEEMYISKSTIQNDFRSVKKY
ncbi:HTH domain-containing protein [Caldibacillus debilis]|uniref:HTH domain-containing protein n=1 Tax=Caldibacillus debilis TaxID=301148 RepID=UPI0026D1FCB2